MRLRWLTLALLVLPAFGANDVFIAQNATGANNGTSCANAKAYTYFNSSGNWSATPTGIQIGPDTTVHLCGTINGPNTVASIVLAFQGTGTAGHPITVKWEPGASISVPTCGVGIGGPGSACIVIQGANHIVLDGNCTAGAGSNAQGTSQCATPSITNTANGSAKANKLDSMGIFDGSLCNDCEFKNLTITHLYDHTNFNDTAGQFGYAIQLRGGVKILVHDNAFLDDAVGYDDAYEPGDSDLEFYNNWCNNFNWCAHVGQNSTANIDTLLFHHNHLGDMANWDSFNDSFHHDGIFPVQDNTGASFTNLAIYNNFADGDVGSCCMTAWIFLNTGMHGPMIFNNVLLNPTGHTGGTAFLMEGGISGDTNYSIFNNFGDCNGINGLNFSNVNGFKIENNAFENCSTYLQMAGHTNTTFDYNVYKNFASGETHSINTANLNVTSVGVPNSGSPLLHNGSTVFLNLTANCTGVFVGLCTGFNGTARPNSAFAWDAGAYQVGIGFTASPTIIPAHHSNNIAVSLAGVGTSWTGSTAFSISGVTGATLVSKSNSSATSELLQITTGSGTGTLTITDTTDSLSTTITVATATVSASPSSGGINTSPTVTMTGTNTLWLSETANGLFSISGGTGSSIGTPTVTSNTSATVVVTPGSSPGAETVTDTSTTATTTFTATQTAMPTCDHSTGTYPGSFSNTCNTVSTGTVILCFSTSTTPVTDGLGTGCSVGTVLANNGSTTISSTVGFNIIAGTSLLPDSTVNTYNYTISTVVTGTTLNGGATLTGGATIK